MTLVGIGEEDQVSVARTVASVLHLGNVLFTESNLLSPLKLHYGGCVHS